MIPIYLPYPSVNHSEKPSTVELMPGVLRLEPSLERSSVTTVLTKSDIVKRIQGRIQYVSDTAISIGKLATATPSEKHFASAVPKIISKLQTKAVQIDCTHNIKYISCNGTVDTLKCPLCNLFFYMQCPDPVNANLVGRNKEIQRRNQYNRKKTNAKV